jgi:hypothetical protein
MLENCAIILLLNACELNINNSFLLGRNIFRDIFLDLQKRTMHQLLKENMTLQIDKQFGHSHDEA